MPQELKDLQVDYVSLVDRAAVRDPQNKSEPRRFLLWKREGANPPTAEGGDSVTPEDLNAAVEKAEREKKELQDALAKAESERDEAIAKAKAMQADKEDVDEDEQMSTEAKKAEIDKAELPVAVREALEKAERDREELSKRASEAEEIAKAERDLRVTREFIAKAQEFKALPVQADSFGPVLKSISEKLSKEEAEELGRILKAADEQIGTSDLFKEVGSGVGGQAFPSDASGEMQRKAEELRKADSSLSQAAAEERVMNNDRALQARYLAEQRR